MFKAYTFRKLYITFKIWWSTADNTWWGFPNKAYYLYAMSECSSVIYAVLKSFEIVGKYYFTLRKTAKYLVVGNISSEKVPS